MLKAYYTDTDNKGDWVDQLGVKPSPLSHHNSKSKTILNSETDLIAVKSRSNYSLVICKLAQRGNQQG